ncbi:hypothetical protein TTHERM_00502510 (macronuclear) [Tetrahymena thermophila SB210]|uniref:Uncharacterized protein n=1 Tax=Tetrahymena thermophila (strain SB210) TaxID=312017 RepID=I7MLG6_TETTS|nr:hypothetical protein TTHERM_00502510 [Tetrahymena thermophila SB210]EAS02060.2 hypothetical protein TTHERM_00502510 [Tetrahymena thermophila SB210]|eukprot:XP_001022305.2 hypothetical protein TTHERM_00502510 [Tetrahymena thermophila SB210]
MNLFLRQIDQLQEIANNIYYQLQKQNLNLFAKCELLQSLLEYKIEQGQNNISLQDFLMGRKDYPYFLDIIFVDINNISNHLPFFSQTHQLLQDMKVTLVGLYGAIQRYNILKDAFLIKTFQRKNELNECEQFRKELLDQYKSKKVIIEVDYQLLRYFFNKFMHDKQYFEQFTCIIRVIQTSQINFNENNESKQNQFNLKLQKYISFCEKCFQRDYKLYIDFQLPKKEIKNNYTKPLQLNINHKRRKQTVILNEYLSNFHLQYEEQLQKFEFNYQYSFIETLQQFRCQFSHLNFAKLLSVSQEINQIEINNIQIFLEDQNSDILQKVNFVCLNQVTSFLFNLQKIKLAQFFIEFNPKAENNFQFLIQLKCIPAQTTIIQGQFNQFKIMIKEIENIYYSELQINGFDELFLKEIAYDKENLQKCLVLYQNIIRISIQKRFDNVQIIEEIKKEIKSVNFLKKASFKKINSKSQNDNYELLRQILIQQKCLEGLHLSFSSNLGDLDLYFFNTQILDLVKKECPKLKLFAMFIDNQELIFNLLKSFDFKIFFKDKQFEVVQDKYYDDNQIGYNVLKFSLSGNYLTLFGQIFDLYKNQYDNLDQKDICQSKNSTLINKTKKNIKYFLQIYFDSSAQLEKLKFTLSKLIQHIDFIDCYYYSEKVFSKSLETYKIYKMKNMQLLFSILPSKINTLIIHEDWDRKLNQFLEILSTNKTTIDCLEINLIMYSYDQSLQEVLKNINYKIIEIYFFYNELQLQNLKTILNSLKLNNYFQEQRCLKKEIEFKIPLQYQQNTYEKLQCVQLIKEMQDNQFDVKCVAQGKKKLPKIFQKVLNSISLYQRILTSYKAMKINTLLSANFRNEIIVQICDLY